jgi:hypothetical protein
VGSFGWHAVSVPLRLGARTSIGFRGTGRWSMGRTVLGSRRTELGAVPNMVASKWIGPSDCPRPWVTCPRARDRGWVAPSSCPRPRVKRSTTLSALRVDIVDARGHVLLKEVGPRPRRQAPARGRPLPPARSSNPSKPPAASAALLCVGSSAMGVSGVAPRFALQHARLWGGDAKRRFIPSTSARPE